MTGGSAAFTAPLTIDYFPYMVQNATLSVTSIGVYAANGGQMAVAPAVTVPATMTSANIKNGSAVLDIPQDGTVLTSSGPATKEVYVVIAYTAQL
jgi:hypothetical protein